MRIIYALGISSDLITRLAEALFHACFGIGLVWGYIGKPMNKFGPLNWAKNAFKVTEGPRFLQSIVVA